MQRCVINSSDRISTETATATGDYPMSSNSVYIFQLGPVPYGQHVHSVCVCATRKLSTSYGHIATLRRNKPANRALFSSKLLERVHNLGVSRVRCTSFVTDTSDEMCARMYKRICIRIKLRLWDGWEGCWSEEVYNHKLIGKWRRCSRSGASHTAHTKMCVVLSNTTSNNTTA